MERSLALCAPLLAVLCPIEPVSAATPPPTRPGWRLELVAEAPVIKAPAVVCTAPDGRIFVGEDPMDISTERADERKGRVVCLHPDGRATTFAEGLHAPFGMQYLEGKLYVLHNPKLTVFTDGGDVAAERTNLIEQTLPEPWKSNWNDHVPSNFRLGMDGYFHFSIGDKGLYGMVGRDGRRVDLRGGGMIRMRPDGTGLEITARGTRNTLDVAITAEDEMFTYDNTDEHHWMGRFTHMVEGGFYGYPHDFIPRRSHMLWKLADYGPGAACGALCYNDDAWPAEFHGNVFIADHVQRNVRRVVLAREGATFREVRNENIFIEPAADFRPVGLHETHDGRGLLITDWVNGGYKEKVEVGRLWRLVRSDGTNAAPVPAWFAPVAMGKGTETGVNELIAGLSHPRRGVRLAAQRALARSSQTANRGVQINAALRHLLTNTSAAAPARWHALWAMDGMAGGAGAREEILGLAAGKHTASLRRQAMRQLGERQVRAAVPILTAQLANADASVRFGAVTALRRIGDAAAIPALLGALGERDLFTRFAVFTALNSLGRAHPGQWTVIVAALESADARARETASHALRETYDGALIDALAALTSDSARPPPARVAALELLAPIHHREAAWTGQWWGTHPALAKPAPRTMEWAGTRTIFAALAGCVNDVDASVRLSAIQGLGAIGESNALPALRARFTGETEIVVQRALLECFGGLRDPEAGPLLTRLLRDIVPPVPSEPVEATPVHRVAPDLLRTTNSLLPAILAAAHALGATWTQTGTADSATAIALAGKLEQLLRTTGQDRQEQTVVLRRLTGAEWWVPVALEALGQFRRPESAPLLAGFARSQDERERTAAFAALSHLDATSAWPVLQPLVTDPSAPVRRAAIKSVGTLKITNAVPLLLAAHANEETRGEALAALTRMPDLRALEAYLDGFSVAGWAWRGECARAIRSIARPARPLLEARVATLSANALNELKQIYEKDGEARRGPLFTHAPETPSTEEYEKFALEHPGDPWRGQQLFFDASGLACLRCHRVAEHGGGVGPDLTVAGRMFPRPVLIESILYPNKAVREGFVQVNIETKDGEAYTGAVKAETAEQVTMLTLDNRTVQIPTARIADRHTTVQSMMPEGLHAALSLAQFADLVAYCESLQTDPREFQPRTPPPGFEPLFNGRDLTGFHPNPNWVARDGVLEHDGQGGHLWHARGLGDFELMLEWRWPDEPKLVRFPVINPAGNEVKDRDGVPAQERVLDAGDSGVLLRGLFKAQANLFCYPVGSGEFWEYRTEAEGEARRSFTPRVRADRPLGQWNEMSITMRGERVSIRLNGHAVIHETALPGVPARGPVGFQHEHGRLQLRHVWIRELP